MACTFYVPRIFLQVKKQSLFFAKDDWLEKNRSQIRFQYNWAIMNKYVGSCLLLFVQFLKFTNKL